VVSCRLSACGLLPPFRRRDGGVAFAFSAFSPFPFPLSAFIVSIIRFVRDSSLQKKKENARAGPPRWRAANADSPPPPPTPYVVLGMRRLALLAALAACALAQPQNCYSYSSCSACIAAGCYEYVSGGCAGSCTSSPTSTCDGVTPINNAAQCPAQPSDAANAGTRSGAAGIAGLGAAAIALTAFFAYGNVERFCGQKSEPPATAPVRTWVLFAASSALWLGLPLQLASPLLPWMVCSAGSSTSFTLATGFYVQGCNKDNNGNTICQFTVTWSDYLNVS
jgi:hypothetical protein